MQAISLGRKFCNENVTSEYAHHAVDRQGSRITHGDNRSILHVITSTWDIQFPEATPLT